MPTRPQFKAFRRSLWPSNFGYGQLWNNGQTLFTISAWIANTQVSGLNSMQLKIWQTGKLYLNCYLLLTISFFQLEQKSIMRPEPYSWSNSTHDAIIETFELVGKFGMSACNNWWKWIRNGNSIQKVYRTYKISNLIRNAQQKFDKFAITLVLTYLFSIIKSILVFMNICLWMKILALLYFHW